MKKIRNINEWLQLFKLIGALFAIIVVVIVFYKLTQTSVSIDVEDNIELTPTQITAMRNIGQWEFLSVSDEEMIDTVRKGLFKDDELVRIYYGTLRLGIDMQKTSKEWIVQKGDTITMLLPPIELLDNEFIDEARTESFYQSGSWNEKDMEALYLQAYRNMKKRCLTPSNIKSAEDNAVTQFDQLMKSMGFKNVSIQFQEQESQKR